MLSSKKCFFLFMSHLNDGAHGISNVLEQVPIKYGIYTNIHLSKKDDISIRWSSNKSSETGKKCEQLHGIEKRVLNQNDQQEKASYIPGGF